MSLMYSENSDNDEFHLLIRNIMLFVLTVNDIRHSVPEQLLAEIATLASHIEKYQALRHDYPLALHSIEKADSPYVLTHIADHLSERLELEKKYIKIMRNSTKPEELTSILKESKSLLNNLFWYEKEKPKVFFARHDYIPLSYIKDKLSIICQRLLQRELETAPTGQTSHK